MNQSDCTRGKAKKAPRIATLGTELVYRTVSKPRIQAEAMRKMFEANPRFAGSELLPDPRKSGFFYVAFVPATEAAQTRLHEAFVNARLAKAETGLCTWEWDRQADGSDVVYTPHINTKTGEIVYHDYRVTDTTCTCPDFEYRCSRVGHACKHLMNRQLRAILPAVGMQESQPVAGFGSEENFRRAIEADFGN